MSESTDKPQDQPTSPDPAPPKAEATAESKGDAPAAAASAEAAKPAGEASAAAPAPAAEAAAEAPKPAPKPKPPARDLPSEEDIAAWVQGADVPTLVYLFGPMPTMKYDGLMAQIKKQEILPQHWRLIRNRDIDESAFDKLGAVGRLRLHYRDQELSRRRVEALRQGWIHLGGRQPSLWNAGDVFAAIRRFIDKKVDVDIHDFLSAVRDVWKGQSVPHGREQLEIVWACLAFIRGKTKK